MQLKTRSAITSAKKLLPIFVLAISGYSARGRVQPILWTLYAWFICALVDVSAFAQNDIVTLRRCRCCSVHKRIFASLFVWQNRALVAL